MRRFVPIMAVLSTTALLAVACIVDPSREVPEEDVANMEGAIIGGTADSTHNAVVALIGDSTCTGTIVAKSDDAAWVLTAGHCEGMHFALQADNYQDCMASLPSCEAVYVVTDDVPHPSWDGLVGNGYDFRLLKIAGVTSSTPVIPVAQSPDGVSDGVPVEVVGYGVTESGGNNTIRQHVIEVVQDHDSLLIYADQADGTGSCTGDSGGPLLINGTVVGVTSFGDLTCTQYGAYGRVQAASPWIASVIGEVAVPTCDDCILSAQAGACSTQLEACVTNADCADLIECLEGCSTQSCEQACVDAHPMGWPLYSALSDCECNLCASECPEVCGGSSTTTSTTSTGPQSSTAVQASSSAAAGVGGLDSGTGEGAGHGSEDAMEDDDDARDGCACGTVGEPPGGSGHLLGLAALAMLAGALVRRQSLKVPGPKGA